MNIIIQLKHQLHHRRSILRRFRWRLIFRLLSLIVFIFILLPIIVVVSYLLIIFHSIQCCKDSSNIIVSLTSVPVRFYYELPMTIHSLLSQTQLPREIRLHITIDQHNFTLAHLKAGIKRFDTSIFVEKLFDKLVRIRFEKYDYGTATKFIPILKEFHSMTAINGTSSQPIVVCDDDHYYHPYTLATLDQYSREFKNSIVGLRGWRIRKDLIWAVNDPYHLIQSYRIAQVYRVGVTTANSAYLIRPSFFDSHIYLDFDQAPADVRRVDDIWMNGHAAKRNIARYVVPFCCPHIGVFRTYALDTYLNAHGMSRAIANNRALKMFGTYWEKNLWYQYSGINAPRSYSWLTGINREWSTRIQKMRFISRVGHKNV